MQTRNPPSFLLFSIYCTHFVLLKKSPCGFNILLLWHYRYTCREVTNKLQWYTRPVRFWYYLSYFYFSFYSSLSPSHCRFSIFLPTQTEPKTFNDASKFECWNQVMKVKLDALVVVFFYLDLHTNAKPVGCRWVYKIKHKLDGNIERFKARLVENWYNQIGGLDYFDTFSLVAKLTTIRLILALASIKNWHLHQLDVNNAFLHVELHEDGYMVLTLGVKSSKSNQVCKLSMSLFGLKHAIRQWCENLASLFLRHGYKQTPQIIHCLLRRHLPHS